MRARRRTITIRGFTLIEMMMSLGCGSLILAAVVAAGVCLQRSFAAVESYSVSQGDQLRVQDYIAMDSRRAVWGSITGLTGNTPAVDNGYWSGGAWVHDATKPVALLLTIPAYYDSNGNAQAPQYSSGNIVYGSSGGTTSISYYQSGTSIMRQVGTSSTVCTSGQTWTNCAKAIATNVYNFSVTPPSQASINADSVSYSITFSPIFISKLYSSSSASVQGTTIYANTFLRNPDARRTVNNSY
jgi:type II secretory pathway component PulJ